MKSRHATTPVDSSSTISPLRPHGSFVRRDGEDWYRIAAVQRLSPFLISLPSDTDLWMFVTSRGGLTAGRVNASGAVFPYLTVDQLHDAHHHTGPVTLVRVRREGAEDLVWEPFAAAGDEDRAVERSLDKNVTGNSLQFAETHHGLGLTFRYTWTACDEFGWVRTAELVNHGDRDLRLDVLDGVRNVLPYGAPLGLQQRAGNLVDAYKKSEIDPETGLGIFSLTAGITDRAEALEVLRANTAWCAGLDGRRTHLHADAVAAFRNGRIVPADDVLNGTRGNYLVSAGLDLAAGDESAWFMALDVGRDHLQLAELRRRLRSGDPGPAVRAALERAGGNLRRIVAAADGLQLTGRAEATAHHQANVLFNNMRGGIFQQNHDIPAGDFAAFVRQRNAEAADRHAALLGGLPDTLTVAVLREKARRTGDPDLVRLAHEYLPLYFGRRHGDPSRPWNAFEIRTRGRNGERELNYEGNWRDIFQNWEALATAFPDFLPGIVAKFVNASTVDGFNPYRLTRQGVDWEIVEPDDPWANIGYWGDHQIIYLLKLLEALQDHAPAELNAMLGEEIFSYAEVPYRIRPYADLVRDPRDTIVFDGDLDARIAERVERLGSDGKLLTDADGGVLHVNLFEKLLVPALSKLSNLVPDAGIWMNTQRPEWNDANNALAGGAVSVVTLCYLRRYLAFLAGLLAGHAGREFAVSADVARWLSAVAEALAGDAPPADGGTGDRARKARMDRLGEAFGDYRARVYEQGLQDRAPLAVDDALALCRDALRLVDASIAANRREDGLYHTYNLLEITAEGDEARVGRLPVMLEGQVAALSSGRIDPVEAVTMLESLFASDLYRADQRSFLLYPARELPGFLARNRVPEGPALAVPLLRDMLQAGDRTVMARDADGMLRFHGDLRQAADLAGVLDDLAAGGGRWAASARRDRAAVLELFETVFDHDSYTGRSGVMYGYEGLGCIYWHMVAKLLLATQEMHQRAERDAAPAELREALDRLYHRVRAGIGYERTVAEYGAFPTDPYSHTPGDGGARQPGMTGQVKEEILTRRGELGVMVRSGTLRFRPRLLKDVEFLAQPDVFRYFDTAGEARELPLDAGSLAFTCCQVPVVYRRGAGQARIRVFRSDGSVTEQAGDALPPQPSAELLSRSGVITRIEVALGAT